MSEVNAGYDTGRYRSTREQLRRSLSQDVTDDSPIARRERAGRARLAIDAPERIDEPLPAVAVSTLR